MFNSKNDMYSKSVSSALVSKVPKDLCLHVQFSKYMCTKFDFFLWWW